MPLRRSQALPRRGTSPSDASSGPWAAVFADLTERFLKHFVARDVQSAVTALWNLEAKEDMNNDGDSL